MESGYPILESRLGGGLSESGWPRAVRPTGAVWRDTHQIHPGRSAWDYLHLQGKIPVGCGWPEQEASTLYSRLPPPIPLVHPSLYPQADTNSKIAALLVGGSLVGVMRGRREVGYSVVGYCCLTSPQPSLLPVLPSSSGLGLSCLTFENGGY